MLYIQVFVGWLHSSRHQFRSTYWFLFFLSHFQFALIRISTIPLTPKASGRSEWLLRQKIISTSLFYTFIYACLYVIKKRFFFGTNSITNESHILHNRFVSSSSSSSSIHCTVSSLLRLYFCCFLDQQIWGVDFCILSLAESGLCWDFVS